ncbi:MAG: YfbU family protein [Sedimentisphaerales bacterium]|nr:YfbU family protein [Sedimentisphaerales bacterium]
MDLSKKERLIIVNQLKILEKLYPEEAKEYSNHRKAIEQGYKLHYSWLTEWLYDEMSEDECKEVLSILEMYRAITSSYRSAEDKQGLEESEIKFPGFDGNEESNQFGYTLYFIVDLGRYDELRGDAEYPDFNSHRPKLKKYKKMLEIWNKYENKHSLTITKIKELLGE